MKKNEVIQLFNIIDDSNIGFKNPQRGRVYSPHGISPCLNCCERGMGEPKIIMGYRTIIGSKQANAYIGSVDDWSPCINAACGLGGADTYDS